MQVQWPSTGSILLVSGNDAIAHEEAKKILSVGGTSTSHVLFDSGTHPDFRYIIPEPKSDWIKIDQIRTLIEWAMGKPQISAKQVAIIYPAHAMNLQAANALLKTLEEPSEDTIFILVTDRPSLIPATLRSRCFWIRMRSTINFVKNTSLAEMILKDLRALEAKATHPVAVSMEWVKEDPKELLRHLLIILHEEAKSAFFEEKEKKMNIRWWAFLDKVFKARRALEEPNQPNLSLLLESLLIEYPNIGL